MRTYKWFSSTLLLCSFCVVYLFVKHISFVVHSGFEKLVHNQGSERDSNGMASILRQPKTGIKDISRFMEIRGSMLAYHGLALQLGPKVKQHCGQRNRRVVIRGTQYGQFSNILISLAHGLGFTEALNEYYRARGEDIRYSLVLPNYMLRALQPFDLTLIQSQYCFYVNEVPSTLEEVEQMPTFTLSTLFSRKKTMVNIFGKFVEACWSTVNYAARSVKQDIDVVKGQVSHYEVFLSEKGNKDTASAPISGRFNDLEISSKMLFFWGKESAIAWRDQNFPSLLSDASDSGGEVSYYTRVYAAVLSALYSSAAPSVVNGALTLARSIVDETTGSSHFEYSTAHRRNLDGQCSSLLKDKSIWDKDFGFLGAEPGGMRSCSADSGDRCVSLEGAHPLCTMQEEFVRRLNNLMGLSRLPMYLSSDLADAEQHSEGGESFLLGYYMKEQLGLSQALSQAEQSCVDIMVCTMGSGLFVGNPASTFTFQIQTLRTLLQRTSMPKARNHDIYFDRSDAQVGPGWISQAMIQSIADSV
jgi:hypothetical protein